LIAQPPRFEVEAAQAVGNPRHSLLEEPPSILGLARLRCVPRHDDEEAPIDDSPLVREAVDQPPI
jgi:hypothetical protein